MNIFEFMFDVEYEEEKQVNLDISFSVNCDSYIALIREGYTKIYDTHSKELKKTLPYLWQVKPYFTALESTTEFDLDNITIIFK